MGGGWWGGGGGEGVVAGWARGGAPVRIIGFPAFLHFILERMRLTGRENLRLPEGSRVGDAIAAHADEYDFDVSRVSVAGLAYHGMRLAGADPERPLTDPPAGPAIPASEIAKLRRAADTVARMVDTTAIAAATQVDVDTTEAIAAGALMDIAERAGAFLDFQDRLRELAAANTATPPTLAPMGRA